MNKLCGSPIREIESQLDDLSQQEFAALKTAIGAGLRTFCLNAWTSAGAQEFETATDDTLFLIDHDYKRELAAMAGFDGTKILSDLLEKTKAFCIMLTHTCVEAEQPVMPTPGLSHLKFARQQFRRERAEQMFLDRAPN